MAVKLLQILAVFIVSYQHACAFKHVILMHGLFGGPIELLDLEGFVKKAHPGTTVTNLNAYDVMSSLRPMWDQSNKIIDMMTEVMHKHPDGVHLICYSQGGLICRAVLESMPDHNVHTFISLSSPQSGQYGDTSFLKYLFPHLIKEEMYKFFYSAEGQKVSIGNYWNDPHHQTLYKQYSQFLAPLNNQSANHTNNQAYKKNFLRLKHLVLIGGPDDGVITPWQSSQFGAYNENETVVEMRKQDWYTKDWFGLRTLDKRGAITTYTVPGHVHLEWPRNQTIFHNYMEKWLI